MSSPDVPSADPDVPGADIAWRRLVPPGPGEPGPLTSLESYLGEPSTRAALDALEKSGGYPRPVLAGLHARGLPELLVPTQATGPQLSALQAIMARRSCGLAITVGATALALLPVYIAGTAGQTAAVTAWLREGALASMLLTELDHGSNLLRNEASARPDGDGGYIFEGEKNLINGAAKHRLLVALLRTRPPATASEFLGGLRDFTLFLVERDDSVQALPRWRTLPARSANLAGVRFNGTRAPGTAVIGRAGEGFKIIQKTFSLSHGGVASLASGCVSGAMEVALGYARERDIYGEPIAALGAIREHLARMAALDVAIAAMAVKAACVANYLGPGAAYVTAAAKYACCALAEEAVSEGRRVLGARALLEDLPYARFVRDVLLYGVFDGTSHVMLETLATQLSRQAAQAQVETPADTLGAVRGMYAAPPRLIADVARQPWFPYGPALADRCGDLAKASGSDLAAALADLAGALSGVVRAARDSGRWADDQALRFELAAVLAETEAMLAACELAVPACRAELGMPAITERDTAAAELAVRWLGDRVTSRLLAAADTVASAAARRAVAGLAPIGGLAPARDRLSVLVAG